MEEQKIDKGEQKLPSVLWNVFVRTLDLYTSNYLGVKSSWNEHNCSLWHRELNQYRINYSDLSKSKVFSKLRDIIGLYYMEYPTPIIASGRYWLNKIQETQDSIDTPEEIESIMYLFDKNLSFCLLYHIEAGCCQMFLIGGKYIIEQ